MKCVNIIVIIMITAIEIIWAKYRRVFEATAPRACRPCPP